MKLTNEDLKRLDILQRTIKETSNRQLEVINNTVQYFINRYGFDPLAQPTEEYDDRTASQD